MLLMYREIYMVSNNGAFNVYRHFLSHFPSKYFINKKINSIVSHFSILSIMYLHMKYIVLGIDTHVPPPPFQEKLCTVDWTEYTV